MVGLTALWLPIVLSAVAVFIASSIVHMVIKYHDKDYGPVPNEDRVMAALRDAGLRPGNYAIPRPKDMKELAKPEVVAKYEAGPVAYVHVIANGVPSMGKFLALWFVFCLLVSFFCAYLAGRVLGPGAEYLEVFQVVGTAAFMTYGLGQISEWIWKGQGASQTVKNLIDGLLYGLVTAGVFGWLWP